MSKIIPYRELQVKLASLEAADQWARKMAHWEAAARLMEGAGQSMAKEAGMFSALGAAAKGLAGKGGAALKKAVGRGPVKPPEIVNKALLGGGGVKPAIMATSGGASRVVTGPPAPTGPMVRKKGTGKLTPATKQPEGSAQVHTLDEAPRPKDLSGTASNVGTKSPGALRPATQAPGALVPASSGAGATAQAADPKSRGLMATAWRNRGPLALGAAGLAAYGAVKAVPAAVRTIEQASATPMAYGGNYSSVNYGYGSPSAYAMPRQPMGPS